MLTLFGAAARAQDSALSKLEAEYQAEPNPVRSARLLAKLGPLEIDKASKDFQRDQNDEAFAVLKQLGDDARKTRDALVATQVNAVRHPAGFKELQIGLRESLRRLNDLSSEVPIDREDEFAVLLSDLTATQNTLIEALFPSSKEKRTKDAKQN